MLDKLKIALVLLVIGAVSGLLIWGTNELTADRIEDNRERARLAVYVDMFPDVDVSKMVFETVDQGNIIEMITMVDSDGNLLGYALRGRHNNPFGVVNVVVGVDRNNNIIDVKITETDNTPTYVALLPDFLKNLQSQDIRDVSYDTSTGATSTYSSVRNIIEDAKLLVAGDTILEAYQSILTDAASYDILFEFDGESYSIEYVIFDDSDNRIGYAYHAEVDGNEFALIVDVDDIFLGLVGIGHSDLDNAFDAFDAFIDTSIEDIALDVSGNLEEQIASIFEDIQTLLTTTMHADYENLVRVIEVFDDNDELIGYGYIGRAEGYNGDNVVKVTINLDGEFTKLDVISTNDTPSFFDLAFGAFEGFYGQTEISQDDAIDGYSGASASGGSLYLIISSALSYHAERMSE